MKVKLELLGPLKLPPEGRHIEREVRRGASVKSILTSGLGYSPKELSFLQVLNEGRVVPLDTRLEGDAAITVSLRLGGG